MNRELTVAALVAIAGFVLWRMSQGESEGEGDAGSGDVTAGDEDSNIFIDTYDDMNNLISGWPSGSAPYQDTIKSAAQKYAVPVSILAWLLWKESRYSQAIIDGTRRSSAGAVGIAQFMPATAAGLGVDPLDPTDAIYGAARYLASLYRSTGTWGQALAAYNWGLGNLRKYGLSRAPAETRDYYTTILSKSGLEATA
jgi:soluble lytic murein transglycosylase-like protein